MKRISAIFLLCMPLFWSQSSLAQDANIRPQECKPEGANMRCVTNASGLKSGDGMSWGKWYTVTSTAPKGYTVSSGSVVAHVQGQDHRCGVTDASPVAQDGPTKGFRSGTSYWAQCYIAEEDANHVAVKFSIQGNENQDQFGNFHPGPRQTGKGIVDASADLTVVYTAIPKK